MTEIAISEREQLAQHEAVIERGMKTFVDVGHALLAIRDGRLYRDGYKTFEEYCRDRWGIARRTAYKYIESTNVFENVHDHAQKPDNLEQVQPLIKLKSPEQQREAWQKAVETAPDGKVTGKHVEQVVQSITKPHVSNNSGNNEWYTPQEIIDRARAVLGVIDLDPASSDIANQTIQASEYYTIDDDGLSKDWIGRVWMNPPYSQPHIERFSNKLVYELDRDAVSEAIVLVNNATETQWFQNMLRVSDAVCFVTGRIRFMDTKGDPSGAPLQGQAILYFGDNNVGFYQTFNDIGVVLWSAE